MKKLRKVTSACDMSWMFCVLACFLQREKVHGWKAHSEEVFSSVFCVKICHKIENISHL